MVRAVGEDASEQKVIDDVKKYGWHCVHIAAEDESPPFSFTLGLYHTYNHPELIIFGLPGKIAHQIFCIAADAAKEGKPINVGKPTEDFVEGYPTLFVRVPKREYREHVGFCRWYYNGNDFPLYQIVWPSRENRFPWHANVPASFGAVQPVLGSVPRKWATASPSTKGNGGRASETLCPHL